MSKSPLKIKAAELNDLKFYAEHLHRISLENGKNGGVIFSPSEEAWDHPFEKWAPEKFPKWQRSLSEVSWERTWLLVSESAVHGQIKLVHQPAIKTCLHRATLMMGIEKAFCSQGYGTQLIKTALDWARQQPSLEWIGLYVFEQNMSAQKLYKKFGFVENGRSQDMFRVYGQSITDISMVLRLNASATN